ncbi:MAG: type III-B CRISPR module-associated protein Cmr5 [Candidatus Competibacter denitrificans]
MAQLTETITRKDQKVQARPNLDQWRAAHAWKCVQGCNDDYINLAKAAPALIMNNGLMQVLAFYQSKGKAHHIALGKHIREWLVLRFPAQRLNAGYADVMQSLFDSQTPRFYQEATDETLLLLRWIRQFAAANNS